MGTNSRLIVVRLVLVVVISYSSLSMAEDSFEFGICYYYGTFRISKPYDNRYGLLEAE